MISLYVTYGNAGCGKTEELTKLVKDFEKQHTSYIILAPTHNALNNIYRRLGAKEEFKAKLKTLHSYFRIDYTTNNKMLGPLQFVSNIVIDEFSLMHIQVFNNIMNYYYNSNRTANVYMFGDPMQLNAVYDDDSYNSITFKELLGYDKVYLKKLQHRMTPLTIKHLYQSVFFNNILSTSCNKYLKQLKYLSTNYRATEDVNKILTALINKDATFSYTFVPKFNIVQYIQQPKYYLLASNYEILQNIYNIVAAAYHSNQNNYITVINKVKPDLNTGASISSFSVLHLYPGCWLRCLETSELYYNGQVLEYTEYVKGALRCFDIFTRQIILISANNIGIYPVGPYNFMTVHKAQGYTLENVIVCYDNMFEATMMYTAVTRAAKTLMFYSNSGPNVEKLLESVHQESLKDLQLIENDLYNQHINRNV